MSDTGLIAVQDSITGFRTSPHRLKVTVTDGLYTTDRYKNVRHCLVIGMIIDLD